MPFIVKATYRRETRKFSFYDGHFPTYDELYQQLNRLFSITRPVYLNRLLFSPQDHGGILIGAEVHTQPEYDAHCHSFSGRIYSNGRLTFTIMDERTPVPVMTEPTSFHPILTSVESLPPMTDSSEQLVLPTPPPPPPHALRHSQRISEYRSSVSMDVDSESGSQAAPPKQCCNINQGKKDLQDLLDTFLRDFRRVIGSAGLTSGQSFFDPLDTPTMKHEKPSSRAGSPLPPLNLDSSLHIPGSYMQASKSNDAHEEEGRAVPQLEPSQTLHPGIWCDFCGKQIRGLRFNCQECPEYDLCANCIVVKQAINKHNTDKATFHRFNTINPPEPNSTTSGNANATGRKEMQTHNTPELANLSGPVTATRAELNSVIHAHVVCDWCDEYIVGNRFKCLNCLDYDLCDSCINITPMPHLAEHYFIKVEIPSRIRFHTTPVPACDTSESSAAVHNARCNLCDSRILGTRYKCTDCPDFDTCTACYAITPEQHPSHTFVKVTSPKNYLPRRTSTAARHFATCDACQKPVVGIRYKCMHPECPDFDLCQDCEALPIPVHPATHPFLKLRSLDTFIPNFRNRGEQRPVVESCATHAPESVTPALRESVYQTPQGTPSPHPTHASDSVSPPSSVDRLNAIRAQAERRLSARIRQLQNYPFSSESTSTLGLAIDPAIEERILRERREAEEKAQALDREIEELEKARRQKHSDALKQSTRSYLESVKCAFADKPEIYNYILKLLIECLGSTENTHTHAIGQSIRTLLDGKPELQQGLDNFLFQEVLVVQPVRPASLQANGSPPLPESSPILAAQLSPRVAPAVVTPEMSQRSSIFSRTLTHQSASPLAAAFVSDVNIPDGHTLPSGAEFVKSWRIRNEGTEAWDGVELSFVGGDRLASADAPLSYPIAHVAPGQEINVECGLMRAPENLGRYLSYWRLHDTQRKPFGPRMWCDIEVIEAESDSQHNSLANSSVVMPVNPSQMPNAEIFGNLLSPGIAPSTVSVMTDEGSSVGSASLVESADSDWDDIPEAFNTTDQGHQGRGDIQEEYQVLYDSGSERA